MPITIVSPTPQVIGPGVGFIVRTDFIGPFATGTTWRLEVHRHGEEANAGCVITAPLWSADNHERRIWLNQDPDGGQATLYARYVAFSTNDLVDLQMQLLAPDGTTVIDSGTVSSLRWDTSASSSQLIPTATAGLTTDQATELSEAHHAVMMSSIGLPGLGLSDLLGLLGPFAHPPAGYQTRELIGDFSGNHAFNRPAPGVGVNAFGITWEVLTYGGGIGLDTGTPEEFELDLLEVSTDVTDRDGHEFTAQTAKWKYSNAYMYFDPSFPTRVNVSIAPSVTMRFYWILARFV